MASAIVWSAAVSGPRLERAAASLRLRAVDLLHRALDDAGLRLHAVHPGTWPGRADGLSYQDIVVAHA